LSLTLLISIGKKYTIYLPKLVVNTLGIKEGDKVILKVSEGRIIIEPLKDPIELALSEDKFACVKPEEIEVVSTEEQQKYIKSSP